MDISADPSHRSTTDPEPGLSHHHGPGGSTVHLDQYGPSSPGSCMGLEHKHGFRGRFAGIHVSLCGDGGYEHQLRPWLLWSSRPRYDPQATALPWMTPWPSVMMQATQVSHTDTHMSTDCDLDPGHLCGLRWQHGPPDMNIDIGCDRTVDPNKVLGHNQDSDVTMSTGGSTGCPVQLGPRKPVWLQVASQTSGIGIDFNDIRSHGH